MTESLEKELQELEEDQVEQKEPEQEEEQGQDEEVPEQESEDENDKQEEERRKAQEAYKERQQKRQQLQAKVDDGQATKQEQDELDELRQFAKQMKYQQMAKQAYSELNSIETKAKNDKEFTTAYPDYETVVNNALEFTKIRLLESGYSEADAEATVNHEKLMIADRAVASGQDPLLAIYEEGRRVNNAFDKFAEKMGYTRGKASKTNLQAQRELSKPSPVTGGAGRGAKAITKSFDEEDDLEVIKNTSIWDIA